MQPLRGPTWQPAPESHTWQVGQTTAVPPPQLPRAHASALVNASPSSHVVPSAFGGPVHWSTHSSQIPVWHWSLLVLQSRALPPYGSS